jgi:hypothetical protein
MSTDVGADFVAHNISLHGSIVKLISSLDDLNEKHVGKFGKLICIEPDGTHHVCFDGGIVAQLMEDFDEFIYTADADCVREPRIRGNA